MLRFHRSPHPTALRAPAPHPSTGPLPGAVLLLVAAAAATAAAAPEPVAVDLSAGRLDFEAEICPNMPDLGQVGGWPRVRVVDLEGDGTGELLFANRQRFGFMDQGEEGLHPAAGYTVPAEFRWREPCVQLGATRDLDGDGVQEILMTARTEDARAWRLWAYDTRRRALVRDDPLPAGPDRNGDGIWDGEYAVVGTVERDGRAPLAILCRTVNSDGVPRGILALDLEDGGIVWDHLMGSNPHPESCRLADLDGDGTTEIVVVGASPHTLRDVVAHDLADDRCELVVLTADGQPLWKRELGPRYFDAQIVVADGDRDGRQEIISATHAHNSVAKDHLAVWSGEDGTLLARADFEAPLRGLAFCGRDPAGPCIMVGSDDGHLRRYVYRDGSVVLAQEIDAGGAVKVLAMGDILPREGIEVAALAAPGRLLVLDCGLRPLAVAEAGYDMFARASIWRPREGASFLLVESWEGHCFSFARAETAWRAYLPWAAGLGGPVLAAALVLGLRRRRGREVAEPDRYLPARLIRELEIRSHGALGATRIVERIAWQLGALVQALPPADALVGRARETVALFTAEKRAGLERILGLAREAGLAAEACADGEGELRRLTGNLARLEEAGFAREVAADVLPAVQAGALSLHASLLGLRRELEGRCTVDAAAVLERVLAGCRDELARLGVDLRRTASADCRCLFFADDLEFVLENLLGNACAALAGAERREIRIDLRREGAALVCRVGDTGEGVADEDRERIFEERFSRRGGTGLGLAVSRQRVEVWGGVLKLAANAPGQGAEFELRLPAPGAGAAATDRGDPPAGRRGRA